jgi:Protein of unknown function (DUF3105)
MARRREQKDERLRRAREREEAERRRRLGGRIVAAGMVALSAAIVAFALSAGGGPGAASNEELRQLRTAAAAAGCTVSDFPSEGRSHTTGHVTYRTNPPTSGPHAPAPAPDQEYDRAPPKENYVHSLEHGRIELQYKPGAPAAVREALRGVYREFTHHMLLFPNNTEMPYEVAATAWKHRLGCPHYNSRVPDALRRFRDAYRDRAPEQVP